MALKFSKYRPDPSQPITSEHREFLEQWGLWDDAERRGVKVGQNGPTGGSEGSDGHPGPGGDGEAVTQPPTPSDDEEDVPYEAWSVDELKEELKERKLAVGGAKAELIARLEKSDADAE